ncbi:MAG: tyrosine--tRNA ligase, partial [Kiritimatiellae bacterium]|nr:tyrosine--tRNA ligase [Kiritimatiellia bacterium]
QEPQVVMTLPLIEGLDGVQKMSKSLGNYIGILEAPREMFGKTMSISDELMWKYYALVLCLPADEVAALKAAVAGGKRHPRDVKDDLARRIVARFHDAAAAERESQEFARVFSENKVPRDIPELALASSECPGSRLGLVTLIVRAGLADSNSVARRLIQQGGVRLDDVRITDPKAEVDVHDGAVLRAGKRGFARIRLA